MSKREYILPKDCEVSPCPMGCGGMTDDPAGGPCKACWAKVYDKNRYEEEQGYDDDYDPRG